MRKLIVLAFAALLTSVGVAGAQSNDQGRRLAGPFCIGKTTVSPLRLKNIYGQTVTVPRAGIVRSIGISQKCNANENRRFGVPVTGGGGAKGDSGPIGPRGPQGASGAAGAKGDTGAKGGGGAKGEAGAKGDTGATGAQGATGADGAPGQQGEVGPAGAKGDPCSRRPGCYRCDGAAGPKGDTGANGAQGPAGAKGDTGATGAQGAKGADGAAGAKGDTGATGAQGPAGAKGDTGATGAQGPAGAKGDKGDTGATGSAGPAGPAGPQGPAGADGLNGSTIITVAGGTSSGDKQFTVTCPQGDVALSGGFDIQGSVTASYRSSSTRRPDRWHFVDDPPVLGSVALGHGVRLLPRGVNGIAIVRTARPPHGRPRLVCGAPSSSRGSGESVFERRAVRRLAVRRQYELHGLVEQRPQPGRDLLDRDAFR